MAMTTAARDAAAARKRRDLRAILTVLLLDAKVIVQAVWRVIIGCTRARHTPKCGERIHARTLTFCRTMPECSGGTGLQVENPHRVPAYRSCRAGGRCGADKNARLLYHRRGGREVGAGGFAVRGVAALRCRLAEERGPRRLHRGDSRRHRESRAEEA